MSVQVLNTLLNYASLPILLPLCIGLFFYKHYTRDFRILVMYLLCTACIEGLANILWSYKRNNLPLLHLHTLLEFLFISLLYREHLSVAWRKYIHGLMLAFSLFAIYNSFMLQSWFTFNTYTRVTESTLVIMYSLLFMYMLLNTEQKKPLRNIPFFWVNSGFLLYFSGNFFLFLLSNYLASRLPLVNSVSWSFHAIILFLLYTFLSSALWIARKR